MDPVFQFLLLARVPSRNVLEVTGDLLIWTTSWLPHSGQIALPQSGQYSMLSTMEWWQSQWSSGHMISSDVSPQ